MRERQLRLSAIKKIIRNRKVNNQEALLTHLGLAGFRVTQATLSRDLKFLKVGKQADGQDGHIYTLPDEEIQREKEESFVQDIRRGCVSLDFTAGLAVIKTLNGHADSVAVALDSLGFDCVLGTVAGDDTVMVALREGCARDEFLGCLHEIVPEIA